MQHWQVGRHTMPMLQSDINTPNRYYQLALSSQPTTGALRDNHFNQLVTDAQDIAQCIQTVLLTPKGSDPLRPTFGSDCQNFIDYPLNTARPHLVREVIDALTHWEPRAKVLQVSVALAGIAAFNVAVTWQFTQGIDDATFVSNVVLGAQ